MFGNETKSAEIKAWGNLNAKFKWNLGIPELVQDWKALFSPKNLREDAIAGVSVACVALPLSLAIALASGVDPAVGLITAVTSSLVCAFFGGTPLSISGPAAAMTILIASIVHEHGMGGLIIAGIGCGILQVLSGVSRLGKWMSLVPLPVIAGFTAGIGALILIGQLPKALGLPPTEANHVWPILAHITNHYQEVSVYSLGLALCAATLAFVLPKFFPRVPAVLIAVLIPSALVSLLGLQVPIVGELPSSLMKAAFPALPRSGYSQLLTATFMVYAIASLQTLLSSSAIDRLYRDIKRHDPDQELIGQGLGNIASALVGGIPVTGLIARSALNIQAGAKTRRASIIHAVFLLLSIFVLAPLISRIPIPVLSGVLFSVALPMLHPRELLQFFRTSRLEAMIYGVTFTVIVFADLMVGVQAGIMLALLITALRFGHVSANLYSFGDRGPSVISLNGSVTFLSSSNLDQIKSKLEKAEMAEGVIVDMSRVRSMDASGGTQFVTLLEDLKRRNIRFAVKGLSAECQRLLLIVEGGQNISSYFALSEAEVHALLEHQNHREGFNRLMYGVHRFRNEVKSHYEELFRSMEHDQAPHTLFITCSDSRINPNLITTTDPGELFIVRNVGNIIPPFGTDDTPAEGAALEFALNVLGVQEIVLCAHSGCGAMKEVLGVHPHTPEELAKIPSIMSWLKQVIQLREKLPADATLRQVCELNALLQLENILTYPIVQEHLKTNKLRIHVWYYDIGGAELDEWDPEKKTFVTLDSGKSSLQK